MVRRSRIQISARAAVAATVLSSCGGEPAAPSTGMFLRLTATIAQRVVTRDNPVPLTFQLENVGTQTVTISFPTGCQINPYIVDAASARVVVPAGGAWGCATVITSLTLEPNAVALHSLLVRAAETTPTGGAVPLVPGQYSAYATVDANEIRLRSDPIAFAVQ